MITRVEQAPLPLPLPSPHQPHAQPPSRVIQPRSEAVKDVKDVEADENSEDLSQPISILLRKSTAKAHEAAERSKGAEWLVKGLLDKEEYIRFLMMFWSVYT